MPAIRVHLLVEIQPDQLWDHVSVVATSGESRIDWFHRDVFMGQPLMNALTKATSELEALLVHLQVVKPGIGLGPGD